MNHRIVLIAALLPCIAGCSTLWRGSNEVDMRQGASSSLVDFLYPNGETPPPHDGSLPRLQLPLRVGLAFVPSAERRSLSAAEKQVLLDNVAAAFEDRPFIASIEVIPDAYLTRARGVQGMRQVASLFGVDAMALVSYDQLSMSAERDGALLYWTVVGALVVKGNSNEVHTMVDTAVFDVKTARLLFRAPGVFQNRSNATLIDDAKERRRLGISGFTNATEDMIVNLDEELEELRSAAKNGERVQVAWHAGSGGGGGSVGIFLFVLLTGTLAARSARRENHKLLATDDGA